MPRIPLIAICSLVSNTCLVVISSWRVFRQSPRCRQQRRRWLCVFVDRFCNRRCKRYPANRMTQADEFVQFFVVRDKRVEFERQLLDFPRGFLCLFSLFRQRFCNYFLCCQPLFDSPSISFRILTKERGGSLMSGVFISSALPPFLCLFFDVLERFSRAAR